MDINEFTPRSRDEALLANLLGQVNELGEPWSRNEALLMKLLGKDVEIVPPQSRIEVLLWALVDMGFGISTWDTVQRLIKLGLHTTVFSIGDQLICYRMTGATVSVGASTGVFSAVMDIDEYLAKIGEAHEKDQFVFDGEAWHLLAWDGTAWHYNPDPVFLDEYGIETTGTPEEGDQIIVTPIREALAWDIVGFDAETFADPDIKHSMTIQLHDVWQQRVFDAKEALYAFPNGLTAGTYYIPVKANSWVAADVGKNFQFTLTKDIPAGGQIVINGSYNVTFDGTTLSTYASPSDAVAIETVTMAEGSDGTALENVYNTFGTYTNSCQRARLGNNRYVQSAARQILNSAASPYGWAPQNMWDRPSDTSTSGFLYRVDPDFTAAIGTPTEVIAKNTVCDGGGSEAIEDKIWLVSRSQAFGTLENNINEGARYPYYEEDPDRLKKVQGTTARYWWLRSPISSYAHLERGVSTDGTLSSSTASSSGGLAPACALI